METETREAKAKVCDSLNGKISALAGSAYAHAVIALLPAIACAL